MEFLDHCRKFIGTDSSTSSGNLEVAELAAHYCEEAGLSVEIQRGVHNGRPQANVIARPYEHDESDELLLQTHLDTVDPGNFALWTRTGANPFKATVYGGAIFGLGAADTKLDFLCKLEAIRRMHKAGRRYRKPFVLVGTYGEEAGMAGAVRLMRQKKVRARWALVGEPTDLKIVNAGKGIAFVEVSIPFSPQEKEYRLRHDLAESASTQSRIFTGTAAHSSSGETENNAIRKMLTYLTKLPDSLVIMEAQGGINPTTIPEEAFLEIDMIGGIRHPVARRISELYKAMCSLEAEFKSVRDDDFDPPYTTLNIGEIRTRDEDVLVRASVRIPPAVNEKIYKQWMERLGQICQDQEATLKIVGYQQPFATPTSSELLSHCMEQLEEMGQHGAPAQQAVTNEANIFSRMGIECVVFGPGRARGNAQTTHEHVALTSLDMAVDFYEGVIRRVCL